MLLLCFNDDFSLSDISGRAILSITLIVVVSVRRNSSSYGCLGKAALFYCGTSWAFHIIMEHWLLNVYKVYRNKKKVISNAYLINPAQK